MSRPPSLNQLAAAPSATLAQAEHGAHQPHDLQQDPVVQLVQDLLCQAVDKGASDLHFEPYEHTFRVRFRIDGVMQQVATPALELQAKICARLKIMAQMDISERRMPQDGRIRLQINGMPTLHFRANALPTLFGEKIVLRVINPAASIAGIDSLGLEPEQKQQFLQALQQPQGILLITGPTGSGKTLSLYTGLDILNTVATNICTVEDPVEINLTGINQVTVNPKVGLSFAVALKSFLRQDPDVLMVGEIRDFETADTAIKAAQTGHLVLSTLHTNSAAETLTRLHHMGVAYFNIATAISLVVAQRLARCLCRHCKIPCVVPEVSLIEIGFSAEELAQPEHIIYKAVGCDKCCEGYKGRIGVFEVMPMNTALAQVIMQGANAIEIKAAATEQGFFDLRRAAILKVLQGILSIEEMTRMTAQ